MKPELHIQQYKDGELSTQELLRNVQQRISWPCSHSQYSLWLHAKMAPESCAYIVPTCLRTKQELNISHLNKAFKDTLKQHSLLRSKVIEIEQQPFLKMGDLDDFEVEVVSRDFIDEQEIFAEMQSLLHSPISLSEGPLIRVIIFEGREELDQFILILAHHIVLDGKSTDVFIDTLLQRYKDLLDGRRTTTGFETTFFSDFVQWERDKLSDLADTVQGYWQNLPNSPTSLPHIQRNESLSVPENRNGAIHRVSISDELREKIQQYCRHHQLSEAVFFFATYVVLLHRFSQDEEILLGMPYDVRPSSKFDNVVGHFVNMLPIHVSANSHRSFANICSNLVENIAHAIDYAWYPHMNIVQQSPLLERREEGLLSYIGFNYHNFLADSSVQTPLRELQQSLSISQERQIAQCGEFALSLDVLPAEELTLHFKYQPNLYDAESVTVLARCFVQLISSVLEQPHGAIVKLAMLNKQEQAELLNAVTGRQVTRPTTRNCYQMFLQQVESYPEQKAVSCADTELTYSQLHQRVERLTYHLANKGVSPLSKVAICMERHCDVLVAYLAIMKLGAVYVSLDPTYPLERLQHMLSDSGCTTTLTHSKWCNYLSALDNDTGMVLRLDEILALSEQENTQSEQVISATLPAHSPAYIKYTSGSTGKPKGVLVSHTSLINFLSAMKYNLAFNANDSILALTTFCFDISELELLLPIVSGGHCHILAADQCKDMTQLKAAIRTLSPTYMQATPTTWSMLFQSGWRNSEGVKVISGGEPLPASLKQAFLDSHSIAWNCYGPTETTIWSTCKQLNSEDEIILGIGIDNTTVMLLDPFLQPVPQGVLGEIYIDGAGLALGYFNKPEITAQRFVANPYAIGKRMYRTGDLGVLNNRGQLCIKGRTDGQVKVRGHRIELSEIELRAESHPSVSKAIAAVTDSADQIMLIVQPVKERAQDDIHQYLSQFLPNYMMPSFIFELDEFPTMLNGKIDRDKVQAAFIDKAVPVMANYIPPNNDFEEILAQMWAQLFKLPQISRDAHFFKLGGHSLLAMLFLNKLEQEYELNIALKTLLDFPVLGDFSDVLLAELLSA